MPGFPVVVVPSGGIPVTMVSINKAPLATVATNGKGLPVTIVPSGGAPLAIEGVGGGPTYSEQWRHDFNGLTDASWFTDGITMVDQNLTGLTEAFAGSDVSVESTIVYEGARSMKCFTPAKTTGVVPKAHVSRDFFTVTQGETMNVSFWMYLPSGLASYDNTFIWDIEINGSNLDDASLAGNYFGLRLALNASRCIKVDREYTAGVDPADGAVAFPLDVWTQITITLLCHSTAGSLAVTIGGTPAFSATGFNTLPTAAQLNTEFGTAVTTAPWYSMTQLGITANGHATASKTAYFDSWWQGVTGP